MTQTPPRPRRLTVQERADLLESGPELLRANGTAFLWRAVAGFSLLACLLAWGAGWYVTAAQFWVFNYSGRQAVRQIPPEQARRLTLAQTAAGRAAGWPRKLAQELKTCKAAPNCWQTVPAALKTVRGLPQVLTARKVSQAAGGGLLLALLPAVVSSSDVAQWERRQRDAQRRQRRQRAQGAT